ncbi:MAG: hypothetical protein EP335_08395 [Alphaproteobacteria bacterium]|nr:MAG: hypothetical protein EP335_08395 [Alphaproteobacteria bacterium]
MVPMKLIWLPGFAALISLLAGILVRRMVARQREAMVGLHAVGLFAFQGGCFLLAMFFAFLAIFHAVTG